MLTVVVAGKAAPGATTSTWALALAWPRPVLVVDADPAGGDMVPGLLPGRLNLDHGVLSWSAAARRLPAMEAAGLISEHVVALPEASQFWLMPGFQNAGQAAALDVGGWERLARALERAGPLLGRDVLVDAGRLSDASCWPVIRSADQVLLTVRQTVRSAHAARNAAAVLRKRLGDLASVALLVVGSGQYNDPAGIAREIGVPLAGELPEDRAAAAVLSDGAAAGLRSGVRGVHRSKLLAAARTVTHQLGATSPVRPPARSVGVAR